MTQQQPTLKVATRPGRAIGGLMAHSLLPTTQGSIRISCPVTLSNVGLLALLPLIRERLNGDIPEWERAELEQLQYRFGAILADMGGTGP